MFMQIFFKSKLEKMEYYKTYSPSYGIPKLSDLICIYTTTSLVL